MAVVLIGSTGNGKSTLGNFLIDPSEHRKTSPTFSMATDNKPHTRHVLAKKTQLLEEDNFLTIIDTPGLNEGPEEDLKHMTDVMRCLQNVGNIQACLFVVKFSSKIDAQYKATVAYYSRLLPTLFERNTAIVMTDFHTDDRSMAVREQQKIDEEQIRENTAQEIKSSGGLLYEPQIFMIDCLPYGDSEIEQSMQKRQNILNFISEQKPAPLASKSVVKPPQIRDKDDKQIEYLQGEINGYTERLKEKKKNAWAILDEVEKRELKRTEIEKELRAKEVELKEKNTSDLITVQTWAVSKKRFRPMSSSKNFHIQLKWKIANVRKWPETDTEIIQWKDYSKTDTEVKGRVQVTTKCTGLWSASLEIQSTRKERFKDDIEILWKEIQEKRVQKSDFEKEQKDRRSKHAEHKSSIEDLEDFISDRREKILKLSDNIMTIEEALARLSKK